MLLPESPLENPFNSGFPPWNSIEPLFLFDPSPLDQEQVAFNSGSLASTPAPVTPNEPEPNNTKTGIFGSDESSPSDDERKRRRMISNRLSARRSRLRKQRHLEKLRTELNQLRTDNSKLSNFVRLAELQNHMILSENDQLRSAAAALRRRLWDIRRQML